MVSPILYIYIYILLLFIIIIIIYYYYYYFNIFIFSLLCGTIIPNNFPIFQRESTTKSQDLIGPLSLGSKPLVAGHSAWHLWCSLWSHWCRAYHRFCHDTWRANILLSSYCCMRLLCFTIYVYVRSPSFESPIGFWNAHHGLFQHPLTAHHLVFRGLYQATQLTSGPGLRLRPPWRLAFWSQPSVFPGFVFRPWWPISSHSTAGGVDA